MKTNLLDNAIKFTVDGGIVELEIVDDKDTISVKISNTGDEIPEEKQKKLFNKFYQGDESHAHSGNGIGLAVVKRIVELHRGEISVESANGMNSFTVTLPKTQLLK